MNRGQIKRVRKELDRLSNAGREWDALRRIEHENAIDEFRTVWDDLWRTQARHALRTTALMDMFLQRVNEFSSVPDTADIRFLRTVGDYLDGKDVTPAINGMTGLSAPAETLRRELLRRGNETTCDDTKLRKLLTSCAITPEAVLQKDYRQMSALLAAYPAIARETLTTLEELLARSRKLNSASAVKNKTRGVTETELRTIDLTVSKVSTEMPPPFFRVVIAPVLDQVSVALRRCAENNPDQGARLALAAPFCMERAIGPDWVELRQKFQLDAAQAFSAADRASLRKTALNATLEERFSLVNKLIGIMSAQDELDEDLQNILIIIYKGIFRELITRRTTISERDQRRLASVFGPFFSKHSEFLYGTNDDLPFLLDAAAAAGCLDTVSALLNTFFAVISRDRAMIANARSMLRLLPPTQEKDVRAFFSKNQPILANDLKALKGMLDICRECGHELDVYVAKGLGMSLITALTMSTLLGAAGRNSFMAMLMGPMSDEPTQICKRLIKGMECFSGNPLFSLPVALAKCFPSGRISGKELRQYLARQIDTNPDAELTITDFLVILETIKQVCETQQMDMLFGDLLSGDSLIQELLGAGLDVLCNNKEQVMRYSTTSLTIIVDLMRRYGDRHGIERYLLLISNAAAERKSTGDEAARKLYENTLDYMSKIMKPEKKKRRPR
jgi:hypothetical protein